MLKKAIEFAVQKPIPAGINPAVVIDKVAKTKNEHTLSVGVHQRNNVVTKEVAYNKEFIGFIAPPQYDTNCQWNLEHNPIRRDLIGRTARIYMPMDCHMHDTPVNGLGYKWVIEFPRHAVWKNQAMGWTFNNDSLSKRQVVFDELAPAIAFCKTRGLGYEVMKPNFRYTPVKNYGDQMGWPGHDTDVNEDC